MCVRLRTSLRRSQALLSELPFCCLCFCLNKARKVCDSLILFSCFEGKQNSSLTVEKVKSKPEVEKLTEGFCL